MKKLVLLVLITVTGVLFAGAQQTISGKVTDDKSGNPMPGVSISLKNGKAIGTTDAQGNFALNVLVVSIVVTGIEAS